MWVLLISSLFICLLLLFYWLFFLALFEFDNALFDIPLSGDIDCIFVLNLLLVYPLASKPIEKIMRCGFVWLFNLHLPLLCFSWFILCSCISFLFSFLVYVSYCATTCTSLLGDLGCGWHWQQWNNRLWGISCCYWALEQDSEGDYSASLTIETTSGATKKFICEGNSDIMPNDCPNGDFFRKWFCFKRGLGNQLTREIILNIFIFQEDSISGLRCKQAYGFNSKIYVTVETNW